MERTSAANGCWTAADRARILAEIADGLWRYVARHARDQRALSHAVADLTGLDVAALDTLRHLHLALCDDVTGFVDEALPLLLARLRPVAPLEPVQSRGIVRGSIRWGATTAARARQADGGRTLFVTATPLPGYDTAEMRLLARLLNGLAATYRILAATGDVSDAGAAGWAARVARAEEQVRDALRHGKVAGLPPAAPTPADVVACWRSPHAATRSLARAYARYRDLVERPSPAALLEALRERVLVPLDDDDLYELWALLEAAAACEEGGWVVATAALAGRDPTPFTYRAPDGHAALRLRFGHTPAHWRASSRYRAVFERYGLAGAVRRPDLIVELWRGARVRRLLIEVKRTRDRGYIAESVYKTLGYLADFEAVFASQRGPRALLLLWEGAVAPGMAADDALLLATHRDYRSLLGALLCRLAADMT